MSGIIVENDTCAVDVDSLVRSLEKRLDSTEWNLGSETQPTIFRVPNAIRQFEPDAYEPVVVALGPYNHGKLSLPKMEGLKVRFLKTFLSRNSEKGLRDYMMEVQRLETKARRAYSEVIEMKSEEFVEMMLIDGCFVLEMLRIFEQPDSEPMNNYLMNNRDQIWATGRAFYDMLMAENQLPFFLLQTLANLNDPSFDLLNAAVKYFLVSHAIFLENFGTIEHFQEILKSQQELHHLLQLLYVLLTYDVKNKIEDALTDKSSSLTQTECTIISCSQIMKKLDKFRYAVFPKLEPPSSYQSDMTTIPWATKLKEAGVKFKRNKGAVSILDITFHEGTMHIPQLHIFDDTSHVLRNLIAFEQFFDGFANHVANYVDLMDSLVDTVEDVDELQEDGIIINCVGSNMTIATMFNQMGKGVQLGREDSYLRHVYKDVNKYANKRRNRWREKLIHDYFSNPWSFISFLAALLLLIFTLIQVIFAALSYVDPPASPASAN